jgi:hypothetical protein
MKDSRVSAESAGHTMVAIKICELMVGSEHHSRILDIDLVSSAQATEADHQEPEQKGKLSTQVGFEPTRSMIIRFRI